MNPFFLLFGMILISTVLFALSRSLCRDPDMLQVDMERERQRALAEAVVRQMDTHELVAIASGRLGAGSLLTSGRGATRVSERANPEESRGVSQVTRLSFVKLSAGTRGSPPIVEAGHTPAGAPLSAAESKEKSLDSNPDTAGSDAKAVNLGPSSSSPRAPSDGMAMERHGSKRGKHVPKKEGVAPDDEVLAGIGSKAGADGENGDGGNTSGERFYSDESCSVCLDEYEEGDQLLQLTCGHVFHRPCINLWLKGHCVCPCCRTDLDQLAQIVQVFPEKDRRLLQRALTRANGNAMSAIEVLLTTEEFGDEALAVADAIAARRGRSAQGEASDGRTEAAPGEAQNTSTDDASAVRDTVRAAGSSLAARFRRSASGGFTGIGGRSPSGNSVSGGSERTRRTPSSRREVDIEQGLGDDSLEVQEAQVEEQGAPALAQESLGDGGGGFDVEQGTFVGVMAGEAGAVAGAAAAAGAAAILAAGNEERKRRRRPVSCSPSREQSHGEHSTAMGSARPASFSLVASRTKRKPVNEIVPDPEPEHYAGASVASQPVQPRADNEDIDIAEVHPILAGAELEEAKWSRSENDVSPSPRGTYLSLSPTGAVSSVVQQLDVPKIESNVFETPLNSSNSMRLQPVTESGGGRDTILTSPQTPIMVDDDALGTPVRGEAIVATPTLEVEHAYASAS